MLIKLVAWQMLKMQCCCFCSSLCSSDFCVC